MLVLAILIIPICVSAEDYLRFDSEKAVTVSTTVKQIEVGGDGYLNLFAHGKVYFNLDPAGTTPNTSSKYLVAGGSLTSQTVYTAKEKVGLLADSGTVTVNFTTIKSRNW